MMTITEEIKQPRVVDIFIVKILDWRYEVFISLFRDNSTSLKPAASSTLLDMDKCISGLQLVIFDLS